MSFGLTLFAIPVRGLPISWVACEITAAGRGVIGTAFSSFKRNFCWCFNLLSSWKVMFALVFFISSTMLYSISSEMISFLDGVVEWYWTGFVWVAFGEDFLPAILSLGVRLGFFCLEMDCGGSSWFLLLVATCNASWSSSSGRMKSHVPYSSMTSSSSVCSSFETSSSCPSDSAFVIEFGGLGSIEGFLL